MTEGVADLAGEQFCRAPDTAEGGGVRFRKENDSQLRPGVQVGCGGVCEDVESGGRDTATGFVVNEFHCHGFDHLFNGVEGRRVHEFPLEGWVVCL